jgi:predicted dehydrogenase
VTDRAGQAGEVRLGLVGCGQWGPNYLRAFSELDGCAMMAVADPSPQRRALVAKRHPNLRLFDDATAMFEVGGVDAVVVATPATSHYTAASQALARGIHCLVEKPMTATVEEAESLVREEAASSALLMVGHIFRHNGALNGTRSPSR